MKKKLLEEMTCSELLELYERYGIKVKLTATRLDLIKGMMTLREIVDNNLKDRI
jgi:hypothetical protein